MLHITEDTPPDMLTGAMDLTVHLPTEGRTVKMSVDRSTPMMDVLVLITTQYNLQVSRYTLEALGMAPTALDYSDRILPYRPNTPLGALDTQHIRLIPKQKAAPPPRPLHTVAHQPFESTFRLKVHLPKNQLYVIRVSRNIYLEAIMTKVCDDKNLDHRKYEFRHPGNLDQILDSKLTLSDYQITEIYLVVKGTLTTFSTNDIMALRREEEKKQMHTKAGGGVFNLIFKKTRNSLEYGSVSSENRSVSPSHSDDSRSVTPPAPLSTTTLMQPKDQPKAPQRKRKPAAPKPPTSTIHLNPGAVAAETTTLPPMRHQEATIKPSSSTEAIVEELPPHQANNNTTTNVCHSRTSSDSSGYHEASILSDNLINNSSLPRIHQRPKTIIGGHEVELRKVAGRIHGDHSKSTGNLMTLASKSKSTTSLMTTGRKKKAAPLPPPQAQPQSNLTSSTQPEIQQQTQSLSISPTTTTTTTTTINETTSLILDNSSTPVKQPLEEEIYVDNAAVVAAASHQESLDVVVEKHRKSIEGSPPSQEPPKIRPRLLRQPIPTPRNHTVHHQRRRLSTTSSNQTINNDDDDDSSSISTLGDDYAATPNTATSMDTSLQSEDDEDIDSLMAQVEEALNPILNLAEATNEPVMAQGGGGRGDDNYQQAINSINIDLFTVAKDKPLNNFDILRGLTAAPIITSSPESPPKRLAAAVDGASIGRSSKFDTMSRKRGFQIGSSLASMETTTSMSSSAADSVSVYSNNTSSETHEEEEQDDDDLKDVNVSMFSAPDNKLATRRKRSGRNELYGIHDSMTNTSQSVSSMDGIPGFKGIKKWNNLNSLDGISLMSSSIGDWGVGGSDTSSESSANHSNSAAHQVKASDEEEPAAVEWKYELPLPPTAFRDDNLTTQCETTTTSATTLVSERFRGDSVVSNPELFEKLNKLKSDDTSVISTEDDNKSIYNKLSLELLQKRKSLVYNREIATTLKSPPSALTHHTTSISTARNQSASGGLPNFKISTYNEPKSKINIYEDDTIRSNQPTDVTYKTRSLMRNTADKSSSAVAKMKAASVVRSGSFSINTWSVANPLKRSTSQAALIHRRNSEEEQESSIETMISKATSTVDVSVGNAGGLQSLGVMKQIRNSLQSPTVDTVDSKPPEESSPSQPEIRRNSNESNHREEQKSEPPKIQLKRWSPPDISLGTWSDRPKSEVIVKRDADYKFKSINNTAGGGVVVSITNNNNNNNNKQHYISSSQKTLPTSDSNNVSIKINGSEPISSSNGTGNVTIRIGPSITYRKPFGNVINRRPHSMIAFDNDDDTVSRRQPPVVTSATLKKSVTHINTNGYNSKTLERPSSVYVVSSNNQQQPTFNNHNRKSWNTLLNQGTLLTNSKMSSSSTTSSYNNTINVNVPFSQMRLKRTDSNKILTANGYGENTEMGFGRVLDTAKPDKRQQNGMMPYCTPPPPPPPPPTANQKVLRQYVNTAEDPRAALLTAIQSFGGKKGLRSIRT